MDFRKSSTSGDRLLRYALAGVVVVILLSSCVKPPPPDLHLERYSKDDIIRAINARANGVSSIKGMASVRIITPDEKYSFKQVTIAAEPNLLYLEAIAIFGRTVGKIVSDGTRLAFIFPKDKVYYSSYDIFDLSRFYPRLTLRMNAEGLVDFLMARLPKGALTNSAQFTLKQEDGYLVLSKTEKDAVEIYWLEPDTFYIKKAYLNLDDDTVAYIKYKGYKTYGTGVAFPSKIEMATEDFTIKIKYGSDLQINVAIDADLLNHAQQ